MVAAIASFGQIGLNSLDVRTHPFRVGKCARNVPIALAVSGIQDKKSIA